MSGTQITIHDEAVQASLSGMAMRAGDLSRGMKLIAALVLASVQRNFEVGGRPSKWAALKPSTLKKRHSGGGPLVVQGFGGGLLGSVHAESSATTATVGTDKIYAAVHQLGAKKGSFGMGLAGGSRRKGIMGSLERGGGWDLSSQRPLPWGDIPARPFLVLQDQDREDIPDVLTKFVLGASGGAAR
jgi:phage virion morphogenesis protein